MSHNERNVGLRFEYTVKQSASWLGGSRNVARTSNSKISQKLIFVVKVVLTVYKEALFLELYLVLLRLPCYSGPVLLQRCGFEIKHCGFCDFLVQYRLIRQTCPFKLILGVLALRSMLFFLLLRQNLTCLLRLVLFRVFSIIKDQYLAPFLPRVGILFVLVPL